MICAPALWKIGACLLIENIVRGNAFVIRMTVRVTFIYYHALAVTGSQVYIKSVLSKMLVENINQLCCFLGCNVSGSMILYNEILVRISTGRVNGYEVYPEGNIGIGHFKTDGRSLKRGSSRKILSRVVSHNRKVCRIASRADALRNGPGASDFTSCGKTVYTGKVRSFQRRSASQTLNGVIC